MIRLLIKYAYDNWWASPENSPINYKFAGASAEDQYVQVRALQNAMEDGAGEVVNGAPQFFSNVTDENAVEVVQQLFGTTDALYYEGSLVISVEDTLLAVIEAVGEALAPFLPAA